MNTMTMSGGGPLEKRPHPARWLGRWVRRIGRRATRGTRFALAVRALRTRMDRLPENRWDMTDAQDAEYTRLHDGVFRDYARLQKLGQRWGYHLP